MNNKLTDILQQDSELFSKKHWSLKLHREDTLKTASSFPLSRSLSVSVFYNSSLIKTFSVPTTHSSVVLQHPQEQRQQLTGVLSLFLVWPLPSSRPHPSGTGCPDHLPLKRVERDTNQDHIPDLPCAARFLVCVWRWPPPQ